MISALSVLKEQDEFALKSQMKVKEALANNVFAKEIIPVEVKSRKGVISVTADEHPKPETSLESLTKLRTAFIKENGTVTAGNASGINDGEQGCRTNEKNVLLNKCCISTTFNKVASNNGFHAWLLSV